MLPIHIKRLSTLNYILPISLIVSFAVCLKDKSFTLDHREVVRNKKYGKTTKAKIWEAKHMARSPASNLLTSLNGKN